MFKNDHEFVDVIKMLQFCLIIMELQFLSV